MYRNNLIDVGIDPAPYGTHSFRRGGCQWFFKECRRDLLAICDWGGWTQEFNHLTIVKYLISGNDTPSEQRENFHNFDEEQVPAEPCRLCGRKCRHR